MPKVRVNGEMFDWDASRKPMSEALAIEDGLKCTYAKWESDMRAGSARALCAFIWLVWRRAGRDVSLEDILAGKIEIDLGDLDIERDTGDTDGGGTPGPTSPTPQASPTTGGATSASSPSGSGSSPGRSGSLKSESSRRSLTTSNPRASDQG